jgi:hypothetical protein
VTATTATGIRTSVFRLEFDPQGERREAARHCEAEVFLESFGNTAEQMAEEYGPYEDASVFLAVTDPGESVVAVARLIVPGPAGLKTLNDLARAPWHLDGAAAAAAAGIDPAATWDFATLGVRRRHPLFHPQLSAALYHGFVLAGRINGIEASVAIIDAAVRNRLESIGILHRPLPGAATAPYLGSPASTPVYAPFEEQLETIRRLRPDSYQLIVTGTGFDGIAVPPPDDFRLRRP